MKTSSLDNAPTEPRGFSGQALPGGK